MHSQNSSDIRKNEITQLIVSKFKHENKCFFHGRFRDDGCIVINGTSKTKEFFDNCQKHLKFISEIVKTWFTEVRDFLQEAWH